MAGARIEIRGLEEALAVVARAADALEAPRPLFAELGETVAVATRRRFEDEKGPGGSPWPASFRARMQGGKTLTDTAGLVQSITWEADETSARIGTNKAYAAIHQFGGVIRAKSAKALFFRLGGKGGEMRMVTSVTIPARPFLGIDDDDEREIEAVALGFLGGLFPAEGGGDGAA